MLLFLAHKKGIFDNTGAASFNLSMGFIAALMASFSGMISVDVSSRTSVEVLGHQGYSFLATVLFGFCLGWDFCFLGLPSFFRYITNNRKLELFVLLS